MTTIILFGITGDLAKKKLIPALAELYSDSIGLGRGFQFIGFGRKAFTPEEFDAFITECSKAFFDRRPDVDLSVANQFASKWAYVISELNEADGYAQLAAAVGHDSDILAYISLPPQFHMDVVNGLSGAGIVSQKDESRGTKSAKVVFEKPFGLDAFHARDSWARIGSLMPSEDVYLVDHYGAKQPIVDFERIGDTGAFAQMRAAGLIQGIRSALVEKKDANGRGSFYDSVGALKDVGQNHVLRMLTSGIRAIASDSQERADIIRSLNPLSVELSQYAGFASEPGVDPETKTETFFRVRDSFEGIDIELVAGKSASEDDNSLTVFYTDGKSLRIPVNAPATKEAYVTVFERALEGDRSVFADIEEVLASWEYIAKVKRLAEGSEVQIYEKGAAL
ncbi:MAG TPA: hypothetical protein VGE62_00060 [Candidatus Paceibacterota bacterium]